MSSMKLTPSCGLPFPKCKLLKSHRQLVTFTKRKSQSVQLNLSTLKTMSYYDCYCVAQAMAMAGMDKAAAPPPPMLLWEILVLHILLRTVWSCLDCRTLSPTTSYISQMSIHDINNLLVLLNSKNKNIVVLFNLSVLASFPYEISTFIKTCFI